MGDRYIKEGQGVPDFVLMDEVSEDALYANLHLRFKADLIYTYIGDVVVSVNPYRRIAALGGDELIKRYNGRYPYENDPHCFALADSAYRALFKHKENQCVIISGESGAGKTEASKIVMRYITAVTPTSKAQDMVRIKDQLLDSNPLLEAFGNAKTLRNDNSSRFGKYMQIQFNHGLAPVGGLVTVYLLEKSRVVTRANDERSFHIFYQLLKAGDDALLSKLHLSRDPAQYHFLKLSSCYAVDTIDDAAEFRLVRNALKVLQFDDDMQFAIFRVLAAVLHLGNATYSAKADAAVLDDPAPVATAAELLCVDPAALQAALLNRTVSAGGQNIKTPLKLAQAQYARDALAKSIYEKVFHLIVRRINDVIQNTKLGKEELKIGLLDIYGFEVFEHNSFEQFCINLVNEKLQQVFIELTLKREQEEYVREEIEWEPVPYFNNRVICELIEEKKKGIISFLDECCTLANLTDADFLRRLDDNFASHKHYESYATCRDKAIGGTSFRLKHYAGDVIYDVTGMIDKNKDELFRDLVAAVNASSDKAIAGLFPPLTDSKKRPETAGFQFRRAVNELIESLLLCEPNYIRCIKPNDEKRAGAMDEERTRHQIRYLGLVENVRVRRAGFAFRAEYERFMHRYKMTTPESWPNWAGSARDGVHHLLKAHGVAPEHFRLGKTKVFLKNPRDLFKFEDLRADRLPGIVTLLQSQWKGVVARKAYKFNRSALRIQKHVRAKQGRDHWRRVRAAMFVQKHFRGWYSRDMWAKRGAVQVLQKHFFAFLAKRWFTREVMVKYANVKQHPKLGKGVQLERPSELLDDAYLYIKDMARVWRAYYMIHQLTPADTEEMKAKIAAYDQFRNQKPWDPAHRYTVVNYVERDADPTRQPLWSTATAGLYQTGDSRILFATDVFKVHHTSKIEQRALIVTENHIIKADYKNFKIHKQPVPLSAVCGIALSKHADTWFVIQCTAPERDIVLALNAMCEKQKLSVQCEDDRLHQLVMVLAKRVAEITGQRPPVTFNDSITYNNTRSAKKPQAPSSSLTFAPESAGVATEGAWPQSRFIKGPNNANTVIYPQRVAKLTYPNTSSFSPLSPRGKKRVKVRTARSKGKEKAAGPAGPSYAGSGGGATGAARAGPAAPM